MITEKAKELIPKARIVSFASWQAHYPAQMIALFQQADDSGKYLSDENIQEITNLAPQLGASLTQAQLLRDKAPEIVAQAREKVLEKFPHITEVGGELYPPERAQACWRDFWHFLRCVTYAIAANQTDYLSPEGLANMNLLYQELQVPLKAMLCGLENLETLSLDEFTSGQQESLKPYFEKLRTALEDFA